ncbi:MAG TPA: hypothetical protein VKQ72_00510 [Aggregatilineales bacterium]|nr:hypothetical protein [Aggregatilineales bacterium]
MVVTKKKLPLLALTSVLIFLVIYVRGIKADLPYRYAFTGDEDYFFTSATHIWQTGLQYQPFYPPLGPYSLSIIDKVMQLTGGTGLQLDTATFFAGRFFSAAMIVLGCCFLYQAGKRMYSVAMGLALMWLFAIDPFVSSMAVILRGDPISLFGVSATLCFSILALKYPQKRRLVWLATLATIVAVFGKYSTAPIALFPAYLWLRWIVPSVRVRLAICAIGLGGVALFVFVLRTFGQSLKTPFDRAGFLFLYSDTLFSPSHLSNSVQAITGSLSPILVLGVLPIALLALAVFWNRLRLFQRNMSLLILTMMAGTLFVFTMTNARYRDIFAVAFGGYFLWTFSTSLLAERFLRPHYANFALAGLTLVLVAPPLISYSQWIDLVRLGDNRVQTSQWLEGHVHTPSGIVKEYNSADFLPQVSGYPKGFNRFVVVDSILDKSASEWFAEGYTYAIADDRGTVAGKNWFRGATDKSLFTGFTLAYQTPNDSPKGGPKMAVFYTFDIKVQVEYRLGDLAEVFGYNVDQRDVCPGATLPMRVFVRALHTTTTSYQTEITLRDPASGRAILAQKQLPMMGNYPTTSWQQYDLIFDDHWVSFGSAINPGTYSLGVALLDPAGNELPIFDSVTKPMGTVVPMGQVRIADCSPAF